MKQDHVTEERPAHRSLRPVLEVEDLTTSLVVGDEVQPIVRGMSLSIYAGEVVGLVGESGSGKSVTARSIIGLLPLRMTVTGKIMFGDVDRLAMSPRALQRLRGERVSMIFQDPRAHIDPLWRIGDFIGEGLRAHDGLSKAVAHDRSAVLLRSLGIIDAERVLRAYPSQLSGGMLQRVMIAGALSCDPQLLIADEATTALDVTVQSDIVGILDGLRASRQLSILFITHDLGLASVICDRIVVMYAGRPMLSQPAGGLFEAPAHPYAAALVAARPRADRRMDRLRTVEGSPLSALEAPLGCPFRSRCEFVIDACAQIDPVLIEVRPGVLTSCIRASEIQSALTRSVESDG